MSALTQTLTDVAGVDTTTLIEKVAQSICAGPPEPMEQECELLLQFWCSLPARDAQLLYETCGKWSLRDLDTRKKVIQFMLVFQGWAGKHAAWHDMNARICVDRGVDPSPHIKASNNLRNT